MIVSMKKIFFDNNGTTQIDPRVVTAMVEEWDLGPSNPSSIHSFGQGARRRLTRAREQVASSLGVRPNEVIFTSGATEALNLAITSLDRRGPILTSPIEHPAVYEPLQALGCPIHYLPIDERGHVQLADVEKALELRPSAIVLGAANSETGVKNPIEAIGALAKSAGIPFVVDGVALLGKEPFTLPGGVSAIAFSSHKIHGPQGVGLLVARKNFPIKPLFIGGGQESLRRSGTENLAGIIGLAKAIELLETELPEAAFRMEKLRDLWEQELAGIFPHLKINGAKDKRVPNTSSITFPGIDGEGFLIELDMQGLAASMGSACSSGAAEPSRVLMEMGLSKEEALSSVRFSFSRFTTEEEINDALAVSRTHIVASEL